MFNAIVVVIAAVVMLAIALASISYIGPMFSDNSARQELATYYTQGVQIHGALHLYEAENGGNAPPGTGPAQVQSLVDAGYLTQVINPKWTIDDLTIFRDIGTLNECVRLNSAAHMNLSSPAIVAYHGCPPCSDAAFQNYPSCTK